MKRSPSSSHRWLAWLLVVLLAGCGGGGGGDATTPTADTSTPPPATGIDGPVIAGANVLRVVIDSGVNKGAINVPYVTVTVCVPGSTTCLDIDHVLVDTGSTGLRLSAAAVASLALPGVTTNAGNPAAECAQFASGFAWGSVKRADIRLGSQTAPGVSVQVINDPAFPTVPPSCTNTGGDIHGNGDAKGILGVGQFVQDCGSACDIGPGVPAVYFGCPASGCGVGTVAVASQVTNPVARLPADNNGVVLVLPAVPPGGAPRVTGSLLLGIGTQANNQLGTATVMTTDARGYFSTTYNGVAYPRSFIDSGSNGFFFTDAGLPECSVSTDFYCPPTATTLTATQVGQNGASRQVEFFVEGVDPLPATTTAAHIGGDPGPSLTQSFDWGLPFFFGRSVFTAISGQQTPGGAGPYFAW
ncbi:DUF3443 family protein [Ramlibacter algicola]|uniref:DUF3443 family protein n=1 Tax=Ramlibacter algicola TaxID=2795217 RepID=A0A934Q0W8_9BURK|nr:DUF3443 family protein [Ramlibacter algicola]MBK0393058.1 DUF3443 family protein [Ramlibacter algicola]